MMDQSIILSNGIHLLMSMSILVTQTMSTISPNCKCIKFDDGYIKHREHGIFTSPNYPVSYKRNFTSYLHHSSHVTRDVSEITSLKSSSSPSSSPSSSSSSSFSSTSSTISSSSLPPPSPQYLTSARYHASLASDHHQHQPHHQQQHGHADDGDDVECLVYSFIGKLNQIVQLSFDSLDLQKPPSLDDCSNGDFVKLYLETDHGSSVPSLSSSSPSKLRSASPANPWTGVIFCGKIPLDAQSIYYSSSNELLLQFSFSPSSSSSPASNGGSPGTIALPTGFSGWYKFVNKSNFESDGEKLSGTLCDFEFLRIDSTTSKPSKHKTSGKFYSPNYPSSYGRGLKCAYHFMAKYNERVKVTFDKIDLANDDLSCLDSVDSITVFDGRSSSSPIIAQLCNNNRFVTVISSGPDLYIEFVTGSSPSPLSSSSSSSNHVTSSSSSSSSSSSNRLNHHYSSQGSTVKGGGKNSLPTWSMQLSPGFHLGQGFSANFEFYIPTMQHLTSDFNNSNTFKISKQNNRNINSHHSQQQQLQQQQLQQQQLQHQQHQQQQHQFQQISSSPAMVQVTTENSIELLNTTQGTNCEFRFSSDNSKNGSFSSPNYPSQYPESLYCTYYFTSSGKERIQIMFTDFDLYNSPEDRLIRDCEESDSVMVLVVINGNRERIDKYCGNHTPVQLMSNGPLLMVEFRSYHQMPMSPMHSIASTGYHSSSGHLFTKNSQNNINRAFRGFKASYRFIKDFGITGGIQDPNRVCAFVFNSSINSNGSFSSPNWPGLYPRDTECHYFFYGASNERIHIQFAYFDVEGVPPCTSDSASDYVEFSNFQTVDRKMPRSCGVKKPTKVSSDGEFFRITFKSNDKFDGTGFEAFYQFRNSTIEDNSNAHRMSNFGLTVHYGQLARVSSTVAWTSLTLVMLYERWYFY